jgi:hypothetical protein
MNKSVSVAEICGFRGMIVAERLPTDVIMRSSSHFPASALGQGRQHSSARTDFSILGSVRQRIAQTNCPLLHPDVPTMAISFGGAADG